jgi:hypothetical protein
MWYKLLRLLAQHARHLSQSNNERRRSENRLFLACCWWRILSVVQRQSRSSVHRSRPPSTGGGRLRSNGACERTVDASSPSSTTEAEDAQSLWQSAPGAAGRGNGTRFRGAGGLVPPRGPLDDSTVELEQHVGAAGAAATTRPRGRCEVSGGWGAGKLVLASGPRRLRAATS